MNKDLNNLIDMTTFNLVCFDKDGTLTKTKSGKDFAESPKDQKLLFDFPNLGLDTIVAVVTNQKGISLGYKTKDFLEQEINYLAKDLLEPGSLDYCVACPDNGDNLLVFDPRNLQCVYKDKNSFALAYNAFDPIKHKHHFGISEELIGKFRKPNPGMLYAVEQLVKRDRKESFNDLIEFEKKIFIGNSDSDRKAAKEANFKYWDIQDWLKVNNIEFLC